METYCYTLDLKNDIRLIEEYKQHHQYVWPEILAGIRQVGIVNMQIFCYQTRMVMVVNVPKGLDVEAAFATLAHLPRQQEWETLMWNYQQAVAEGQKWVKMERIFSL